MVYSLFLFFLILIHALIFLDFLGGAGARREGEGAGAGARGEGGEADRCGAAVRAPAVDPKPCRGQSQADSELQGN